ncbi:MAG: type II toxin-antitoxin system HicB family antitoxin [Cyanobacteria bacterium P01_A01_bin.40]
MKSLQDYTIVIRPDDNNIFVAYVPAIEGCHAWGETAEAAKAELDNVFAMIVEEYQEIDQEIGRSLPQDVELVINNAS